MIVEQCGHWCYGVRASLCAWHVLFLYFVSQCIHWTIPTWARFLFRNFFMKTLHNIVGSCVCVRVIQFVLATYLQAFIDVTIIMPWWAEPWRHTCVFVTPPYLTYSRLELIRKLNITTFPAIVIYHTSRPVCISGTPRSNSWLLSSSNDFKTEKLPRPSQRKQIFSLSPEN